MSKKKTTPITVRLKKGKHATQPWTFAIDDIGPGPKVTVRERYATKRTAWKGALRKLKAWKGSFASPQHTATGRAIVRVVAMLAVYLFAGIAQGQSLYVDVAAKYGVTYADGSKRIGEKYAAGKDTIGTGLYWAWQRMKNAGMPYATFRNSYLGWGIAQDVAWTGEAPNNLKSGYQNTYSFADWTGARGKWLMNRTAQLPRGGMEGASSFWYAGQGSDHGQHATEFVMKDDDWWPTNTTERRLFETPNSALDGANNYSYNESFRVERILLSGPAKFGDGIVRIGLFLRRAGECTWVHQVRANEFQYGFVAVGGVPLTCGTITAFQNEFCGFAGLGTALSTINITTLSGDDNAELLGLHDRGYGAPGGNVNAGLLKCEGGITAGHVTRNQVAVFAEGQYSVNVGATSFSNKAPSVPEAMFVLNPTLGGGAGQKSHLKVGTCKGFGYQYLVSNRVTGAKWTSAGDLASVGFEHYASGDALYTNASGVNKVTGTPPPQTGTWSCTAWSACANGTQTRTCTCSDTCSAPKPAESQTCTVTPEPSVLTFTPLSPLKDGTVEGVLREARFAVDGNPSTFWISDRSMANGQAVEVSFPSRSVAGVTFSTGRYNNSYPRTYTVEYWSGAAWVKLGSYTGAVSSTATWGAVTAGKLRITCTASNGNWWAINEIQLR